MSVFLASSLCLAFCRNSGSLSGAALDVQPQLQGPGSSGCWGLVIMLAPLKLPACTLYPGP